MNPASGLGVVCSLLCLAAALTAGVAQISLRALGQERVREMIDGGKAGRALRRWLDAPLRLLLSILTARIGLTALAAWLMALQAEWLLGPGSMLAGALTAPLIQIVVGEVLLSTWAKHRAERVASTAALLFTPVDILLWPFSALLELITRRVARTLSHGDPQAEKAGPFLTEDDLARLWGLAPQAGQPPDPDQQLLQSLLTFQDTVVKEVMIPRARIVALDVDTPLDEVQRLFADTGHERIPIYQGSLDTVVGVLFMTDVLHAMTTRETLNVRQAMRRPYFIPEVMRVSDLLREFQRRRTHMALVVDEFGTTSGVVTLQDVVEEIVGDVRDEDDVQEMSIRELSPGKWVMDGRTPVAVASEALHVELPSNGGYETVGGFMIATLGRLPGVGSKLRFQDLQFVVKEADEKRVCRIHVEKLAPESIPAEGEPQREG
ncbi:MAG: hemolysin family protein [Myxococcota bacterium]